MIVSATDRTWVTVTAWAVRAHEFVEDIPLSAIASSVVASIAHRTSAPVLGLSGGVSSPWALRRAQAVFETPKNLAKNLAENLTAAAVRLRSPSPRSVPAVRSHSRTRSGTKSAIFEGQFGERALATTRLDL